MFSLDKENILDNYENRVSMIKRRKEKIDWKIRSLQFISRIVG